MSQAPDPADRQPTAMEKKRNWTPMIASSVFGGVVAVLAAPTIVALMPAGTVPFIAGTTATGILGGVAAKVTGNAFGSDKTVFTIHHHLVQHSYRKTVEQYIGTILENVIMAIRTNSHFEVQNRVYFDVDDNLRFEINEKRRTYFDFSFKVIPPPGTLPQPLDRGVSAPDLPDYDPQSRETVVAGTKSLVDGVYNGIKQGALFGLANGASASLLFLFLGKAGIILGVSGATKLVDQINHLAPPSTAPEKTALRMEFVAEVRHQVDRLIDCAKENRVGLELDMQIGPTSNSTGAVEKFCQFNRTVGKKVNMA